jgi:hypothetical protein
MGLGVGIVLIAIGAVLAFAIHVTATGVDLHTIGIILMAVGALGVLLSLVLWSSWIGPGYRRGATTTTTVDDRGLWRITSSSNQEQATNKEQHMIVLGIILAIIGLLVGIPVLWTIGIVLVVIGLVLALLGMAGHAVGGRAHYYWSHSS